MWIVNSLNTAPFSSKCSNADSFSSPWWCLLFLCFLSKLVKMWLGTGDVNAHINESKVTALTSIEFVNAVKLLWCYVDSVYDLFGFVLGSPLDLGVLFFWNSFHAFAFYSRIWMAYSSTSYLISTLIIMLIFNCLTTFFDHIVKFWVLSHIIIVFFEITFSCIFTPYSYLFKSTYLE